MPEWPHALHDRSLDVPPRLALRVGGHRPREPGTASSTRRSSTVRSPDHAYHDGIGSSGSGCPAFGWGGGPAWPSCSPPPFWPGTAKASGSIGAGGPPRTEEAGRSSTPRFAASSDAWRGRMRPGAGGASRRSSPCSATRSPSSPSPRCAPGQPPAPENLTGKCSQRGFIGHRAALHSVTPYGKRS